MPDTAFKPTQSFLPALLSFQASYHSAHLCSYNLFQPWCLQISFSPFKSAVISHCFTYPRSYVFLETIEDSQETIEDQSSRQDSQKSGVSHCISIIIPQFLWLVHLAWSHSRLGQTNWGMMMIQPQLAFVTHV